MTQENSFANTLTLLDSYDTTLSKMIEAYDDAQVSLSYLKFNNPYCPITIQGYKVTPALKKINSSFNIIQ